jgi:hypothetical protein
MLTIGERLKRLSVPLTLDNFFAEMQGTLSYTYTCWGLGEWELGNEEKQIKRMEEKIVEQESVCPLLKREPLGLGHASRHYRELRELLSAFRVLLKVHNAMHNPSALWEPDLCLS